MILSKEFRFEASHRLPFHEGKCHRLHGHSWVLTVEVEGPVDSRTGMVIDYADIKRFVQPIVDDLDHRHLGTWESICLEKELFEESNVPWLPLDFNATSENLLVEIARRLDLQFPWSLLILFETCTSAAILTRQEYDASQEKG
jgi:6-pyruvoyltetrahydropterin/6-carboxytetrahydropterin synthase